ncbi:hypothetical protein PCK1_003183 [Pneumocystis canis]|nr:hypothetical protein PCK1_003183 [Pneumocystis canis]
MTYIGAIFLSLKAQNEHGISVKDYGRYHKYCTAKLHRLSKSLRIQKNDKEYIKNKELEPEKYKKYCDFLVINSERAWAYAMELKRIKNHSKTKVNHQRIVRRLLKAYQYASYLNKIMDQESPIHKLQVFEYVSTKKGQLAFERRQWKQSLTSFLEARLILEIIYENDDFRPLIKELISSIEQNIRYCAYQEKIPSDDILDLSRKNVVNNESLTSLLISVNSEILNPRSKFHSPLVSKIKWQSHIAFIENIDVSISLSSIQDIYQSINNKIQTNACEKIHEYDQLFSTYVQAENVIKKAIEELEIINEHFGAQDKTQNLYISYTYVAYNHILEQIKRDLQLISELNMKSSIKGSKQYILCKLIKLYSGILQNLNTMSELPGSQRCLTIAESYFLFLDHKSALALAIRSYDYLSKISIINDKELITVNKTKLIKSKNNINIKMIQFHAFLCLSIQEINEKDVFFKVCLYMILFIVLMK